MKSLITAVLETIVLFAAIALVFIGAAIFKYENPYEDFKEKHPDTVITVGVAAGVVEEGETVTGELLAKKLFGAKTEKALPQAAADFFNREISEFKAKVLNLYWIVVIVAGILCLAFGIGWPMALFRGFSPAQFFDDTIVSKTHVYVDQEGNYRGRVGETRSCLMTVITWVLMLWVAMFWGFMLPLFIPLNIILGLIRLTVSLISTALFGNASSVKRTASAGKGGKENYTIFSEHGRFAVGGDKHPNRKLYFNEYYNAVIVQRVLQRDEEKERFSDQDASDTIQYGDEALHQKFLKKNVMQLFELVCSRKKRNAAVPVQNDINNRNYRCSTAERDEYTAGYIIKYNRNDNYMLFRYTHNLNFAMTVMHYDSQKIVFDVPQWNKWATTKPENRPSYIDDDYIEIPANEDWEW